MAGTDARITEYRRKWREITEAYGNLCFYCRIEIATSLDHVVPYSWDQDSTDENLVPCCLLCNCIAWNRHFDDIEQKRQYILAQRAKRANTKAICIDCLLPYTFRTHSPSMFLCAECFDEEYGTRYASQQSWHKWLRQLYDAGIPAEAHRIMKCAFGQSRDRKAKIEYLIDQYFYYLNSDETFAERLIR